MTKPRDRATAVILGLVILGGTAALVIGVGRWSGSDPSGAAREAQAALDEGEALEVSGDVQGAIAAYRALVPKDKLPDDLRLLILLKLGSALRMAGDIEAAVSLYQGVARDWPDCSAGIEKRILDARVERDIQARAAAIIAELSGESGKVDESMLRLGAVGVKAAPLLEVFVRSSGDPVVRRRAALILVILGDPSFLELAISSREAVDEIAGWLLRAGEAERTRFREALRARASAMEGGDSARKLAPWVMAYLSLAAGDTADGRRTLELLVSDPRPAHLEEVLSRAGTNEEVAEALKAELVRRVPGSRGLLDVYAAVEGGPRADRRVAEILDRLLPPATAPDRSRWYPAPPWATRLFGALLDRSDPDLVRDVLRRLPQGAEAIVVSGSASGTPGRATVNPRILANSLATRSAMACRLVAEHTCDPGLRSACVLRLIEGASAEPGTTHELEEFVESSDPSELDELLDPERQPGGEFPPLMATTAGQVSFLSSLSVSRSLWTRRWAWRSLCASVASDGPRVSTEVCLEALRASKRLIGEIPGEPLRRWNLQRSGLGRVYPPGVRWDVTVDSGSLGQAARLGSSEIRREVLELLFEVLERDHGRVRELFPGPWIGAHYLGTGVLASVVEICRESGISPWDLAAEGTRGAVPFLRTWIESGLRDFEQPGSPGALWARSARRGVEATVRRALDPDLEVTEREELVTVLTEYLARIPYAPAEESAARGRLAMVGARSVLATLWPADRLEPSEAAQLGAFRRAMRPLVADPKLSPGHRYLALSASGKCEPGRGSDLFFGGDRMDEAETLIRALHGPDPILESYSTEAAATLELFVPERAIPALHEAFSRSGIPGFRMWAARPLLGSRPESEEARSICARLARDPDRRVRRAALESMVAARDRRGLLEELHHAELKTADQAQDALWIAQQLEGLEGR